MYWLYVRALESTITRCKNGKYLHFTIATRINITEMKKIELIDWLI